MKKLTSLLLTAILTIAMAIPCMAYDDALEIEIMKENNPVALTIDGDSFVTQRDGQHLEDKYILSQLELQGVTTLGDYYAWKETNGLATEVYANEILAIRIDYATKKAMLADAFAKGDVNLIWQIWNTLW